MKKFKSDDLDRLSALPDSLILKIISSLEMRDVVCPSLLSKRWKDIWTTIPCLDFDEPWDKSSDEPLYSWVSTRNFVSRTLFIWKGVNIEKFRISFLNGFEKSLFSDLDLWLRFANERKVEMLCVYLEIDSDSDPVYSLPQCLYSCSSVKDLFLCGCELQIRGKVKWDQLKKLKFDGCGLNQNAINQIFSGSPQLEVLDLLDISDRCGNLTFQSNSLKKLSIRKVTSYTEFDPSNYTELTICASNLETLVVCGDAYSKCSLIDVSSLTDVTLHFFEKWLSVVEVTLRQILPRIQHVEAVTLSTCCLKVLRVLKDKYPIYPLSNVKLLKISSPVDSHELVCLLEIFPKLEMLVIDWDLHNRRIVQSGMILHLNHGDGEEFKFDEEIFLKSEETILESVMVHLSTVEIGWFFYEASLFRFVEFLLKHATAMEKIAIQERGMRDQPNDTFMAEQKLQSLQTSFPNVELTFCRK